MVWGWGRGGMGVTMMFGKAVRDAPGVCIHQPKLNQPKLNQTKLN